MKIDIVLASYNGERFIEEQIRSIQKNINYDQLVARVIIVDDGSTDNTESIVTKLLIKDPKIEWQINTSNLHGPSNNFAFGLAQTTSEYIMLSDQDDIWLPEKISTSFAEIQSLQTLHSSKVGSIDGSIPLLVFSDKLIVDEQLNLISNSYFSLKKIPENWHLNFNRLCQQNVASGCTMLFNRSLLRLALPIPKTAYMHDWWLVLVANYCGQVSLIPQPLIKYRQHQHNSIGANKVSKWQLITQFNQHLHKFKHSFVKTSKQAQAFELFINKHTLKSNNSLSALAQIEYLPIGKRLMLFAKQIITRSNFLGKIALCIVLLTIKVKKKPKPDFIEHSK